MKTKKLLSLLLVVIMVATLTVTASAGQAKTVLSVGKSTVYSIENGTLVATQDVSAASGSVNNITMESMWEEYLRIDEIKQNGDNIDISVTPLKPMSDEAISNLTDSEKVIINYKVKGSSFIWDPGHVFVWFDEIKSDDSVYLDLDENTTEILEKKELDQNYNLVVNEGTKNDVTKVKLSWEIKDINATRTDNKVWNTTDLCWETSTSSTEIMQEGTAKFTLENYSSVKIDATASFKAETGFKGAASYDVTGGNVTLDTANGNDTYSKTNVPTKVINATVTPDDEDFNGLTATTTAAKYGTYTVTISKAKEMVTMTFTRTSSSTSLSYNGKNYDMNESFSFKVPKNSVVSIVSTGVVGEGPTQSTLTVDGKTVTQYSETGSITAWTNISDGTVVTEDMTISTFSCILSGSQITLADGSTKLIDDVTTEDKLMTFNFYEGKLDGNYPMYVMKHENVVSDVITVTLDNGTVLEMCDWQQFFDMDQKSYFDIDAVNYKEAVGRDIMFVKNGKATAARIANVAMETRICTSYEIFTEYNKNFVSNGILTVEPETYLQGVYTIGDDLKIDTEQYQKDVNSYGRYTYEEFADIMTSDEFEKMNIADKKIAVGKGNVSEEWLFALYKMWTPLYN